MTPEQLKNKTFAEIKDGLSAKRMEVYQALWKHGPCTCRELAQMMGWDLNSVAPRVSNLCRDGFAKLVAEAPNKRGIYEAIDLDEAERNFARARARLLAGAEQTMMSYAIRN